MHRNYILHQKNLGAWARFGGPMPPGPNIEPPLSTDKYLSYSCQIFYYKHVYRKSLFNKTKSYSAIVVCYSHSIIQSINQSIKPQSYPCSQCTSTWRRTCPCSTIRIHALQCAPLHLLVQPLTTSSVFSFHMLHALPVS